LFFTNELDEALQNSEIAFIAVGTPMGDDGSADLMKKDVILLKAGHEILKQVE
jgi:UDPglucose 6-dehydrogenase|tara:strand:+ start:82 stop:240 length:159 start_codon:yes stop_codon:yes gene_type:complete